MAHLRILACGQCKTIEELPDYDGPVEHDYLLANLVDRHQTNGHPHAPALLSKVEEADWSDTNKQSEIVREVGARLNGGETGLGTAFYDLKNTFQADALKCFSEHNRNPGCGDYKSDRKRLVSGNEKEIKRETGVTVRSNRYLCEFCPVHSLVQQAQNRKAGLDK